VGSNAVLMREPTELGSDHDLTEQIFWISSLNFNGSQVLAVRVRCLSIVVPHGRREKGWKRGQGIHAGPRRHRRDATSSLRRIGQLA
jgi:hypothetical protein